MTKKEIFSKLKNYNNELEQVLEKKDFSSDIKNLLLSMFYKIEMGYKDYQKVKRVNKEKNELMEELINIVDKNCNKIEIVEPSSAKGKILQKYNLHSISDSTYKKIISYPIEADLLYAITELDKKKYNIKEEHYIEKQTFEKMLNMGYCMNIKEIIRDFSGWSWKIEEKDIENIYYNLIFQNIRILVGYKFLEEWKNEFEENTDYIIKLKEKLSHLYGAQNAIILYRRLYITLSLIINENNKKFKEKLIEERKKIEEEIEIIKDKPKYLEKLTKNKKELTRKIKQIDEIINNDNLLEKELAKRKKEMGKKGQLLNKQYLKFILGEERKNTIDKMQKISLIMNPKNYVTNKNKLEEKYEKINDVLEEIEKGNLYENILEFQKQFLKCISIKEKNSNNKKVLMDLIYYIRYYVQLPISEGKTIKDVDELRRDINKIQEILITKCINLKMINIVSNNSEINYKIIKRVLLLKVADLENIELTVKPKYNKLKIDVYEKEELENSFEIEVEGTAEKVDIKTEKKFKLFI